MRYTILIAFSIVSFQLFAQKGNVIGIASQANLKTITGFSLEFERLNQLSENFSLASRVGLGFFKPSSGQQSFTFELQRGFKYNLSEQFHIEQFFGLGIMYSRYESKYWYENDWHNLIYTGQNATSFDYIPSIATGLGYCFGKDGSLNNILWVRPKVYWQLTTNLPSQPNFLFQIGYSRKLTG